jgi:hypothetical protein
MEHTPLIVENSRAGYGQEALAPSEESFLAIVEVILQSTRSEFRDPACDAADASGPQT